MGEEQDSLLNEEDVCQLRTAGQWIAYKFFTAQSSTLSILGSSVSVIVNCNFNLLVNYHVVYR